MKSKTIILSAEGNSGRGILTIYEEDDLLKCKLRLYNIPNLNRFCKLGIYHNNEVFSANLLEKSGVYLSSFVGDFNIEKDFYTAIVDTSNNNQVILSGGTYAGFYFNNQDVFESIEKENPQTNLVSYEEFDDSPNAEHNSIYSGNSSTQMHSAKCCDEDKCAHCKYKEYFYSMQNSNKQENTQFDEAENSTKGTLRQAQGDNNVMLSGAETSPNAEQRDNFKDEKQQTSVLDALIPQFKYVFENYQADETLNGLITNGKFVKIEENNEQFSIGAIYEQDEMKYICYAVLKDYNTPAPQELGEHYQWLPLDKEDPLSEGYYIVFQDAHDLKIVDL